MHLGIVHHIAMGCLDALQGPLHGLAVNVHPAGGTRGQELPAGRGEGLRTLLAALWGGGNLTDPANVASGTGCRSPRSCQMGECLSLVPEQLRLEERPADQTACTPPPPCTLGERAGPAPSVGGSLLINGVHNLGDAGLLPIAQLLTRLPEAQVLSWGESGERAATQQAGSEEAIVWRVGKRGNSSSSDRLPEAPAPSLEEEAT